jgi:hypothetical protein
LGKYSAEQRGHNECKDKAAGSSATSASLRPRFAIAKKAAGKKYHLAITSVLKNIVRHVLLRLARPLINVFWQETGSPPPKSTRFLRFEQLRSGRIKIPSWKQIGNC